MEKLYKAVATSTLVVVSSSITALADYRPHAYTLAPDLHITNIQTCNPSRFVSGLQIVGHGQISYYVDNKHEDECFDFPVTVLPAGTNSRDLADVFRFLGTSNFDLYGRVAACPLTIVYYTNGWGDQSTIADGDFYQKGSPTGPRSGVHFVGKNGVDYSGWDYGLGGNASTMWGGSMQTASDGRTPLMVWFPTVSGTQTFTASMGGSVRCSIELDYDPS